MSTIERLPLTRQRIAEAALLLGDEDGLDKLSMRKVGASLGVEAMSLYNHVGNKDDLLDAVGDLLYGDVLSRFTNDPQVSWQDNARALVSAFWDVAMEHPNVVAIMLDRPIPSVTKMLFLQQCYDVFVSAGFPVKEAALAFNTVAGWMTGVVRSEMTLMKALSEQGNPFKKDEVPPEFHGVIDFMDCCNAWTPMQRVDAGFNTLLAGLEKELADKGW
jgi:AcrR family transcriptional regulator